MRKRKRKRASRFYFPESSIISKLKRTSGSRHIVNLKTWNVFLVFGFKSSCDEDDDGAAVVVADTTTATALATVST